MAGNRQGKRDFVNRLQGQYNADAIVQAEKQKKKDDERLRERIAKCERMGLGLGTRLGTASGQPVPSLGLHNQRQGNFVGLLQSRYNVDSEERARKLKQDEEAKALEQQRLRIEALQVTKDEGVGPTAVGRPTSGGDESQLTDEDRRRRHVAQLQQQYQRAREDSTNGNSNTPKAPHGG